MPIAHANAPLLQTQRNEVFKRVAVAGFGARDFDWTYRVHRQQRVDDLLYRGNTEYHFTFIPGDEWTVMYGPAETLSETTQTPGNFASVLTRVDWWLAYLRREIDAPDMWSGAFDAVQQTQLMDRTDDNSKFTEAETAEAVARIEQLRVYLIESGDRDDTELATINARMDYLIERVTVFGRFDWRNVAAGIVVELVARGLLDTGVAGSALNFIVGAVAALLK